MSARSEVRENGTLFARDSRDEDIEVEPARIRDCDVKGLAVRFAFGFTISVIVGVIGLVAGDRIAGLFLAFPAILPASLTLIAENDGEAQARVDAAGACFGGIGLAAFGFVSWFLLPRTAPVLAEVAALVAWCVVAIGAYLAVRARLRSR
jgi:hypothetical protein